MAWIVGIDEAGYGPNLGPFVQVATSAWLPEHDPTGWQVLHQSIRRANGRADRDRRLVIDDSKKVYHGTQALEKLERGIRGWFGWPKQTLGDLLGQHGLPETLSECQKEPWFDGDMPLTFSGLTSAQVSLPGELVQVGPCLIHMAQPERFNQVLAATGTKATLLTKGLMELLRGLLPKIPGEEPIFCWCDKQGGRNFYGAMLQETFPQCWIKTEQESATESRYQILQWQRPVTVVFRPRADGASMVVALASMLAKYLREVLMIQFNDYWQKHIPGLVPTAGYPLDAKRFFAEIQPYLQRLNWTEQKLWRKK